MNFDTEFINCVDEIQRVALEIYGKYDLEKSMLWMTEEFGEFFKSIRKSPILVKYSINHNKNMFYFYIYHLYIKYLHLPKHSNIY